MKRWWFWSGLAILFWVLAFAPADLGILAYFAIGPWCVLACNLHGKRLFFVGYLTGAGILTAGCWWLARTQVLNLFMMVVVEALFFAVFALALRFLLVVRRWPAVLAAPVIFCVMEFLRFRIPLDGFPWLLLGYSQHDFLSLLQLSDLTGVLGLSALLAMASGALFDAFMAQKRRRLGLLLFGLCFLAAGGYGQHRLAADLGQRQGPRVAVVQANIEQRLKVFGTSREEILLRHSRLSMEAFEAADRSLDLLVWAETMLPFRLRHRTSVQAMESSALVEQDLGLIARSLGSAFLIGVETINHADFQAPGFEHWNSAVLLDKTGQRVGSYDKIILVPGGEYLPFATVLPKRWAKGLLEWIRSMAGFAPNLSAGDKLEPLAVSSEVATYQMGTTICYEIAYPSLFRRYVDRGTDFFVNISNEAWFYESAEFAQYTAMAAFRAAETKRSLVRCANSGSSGFIDPWGRVTPLQSPEGRLHGFAGTLIGQPVIVATETIYTKFGDWLGWLCAGTLVLAFVVPRPGRWLRISS